MHLGPLCFLLLDNGLEKVIRGFGCGGRELVGSALLGDHAEVVADFADDASLFPGFTFGGILSGGFVELPAALREDPAATACGLDEKHIVLVGGKRNYARD